eukprot:2026158-Pleurochrysis_carterae.AAC.1
MSATRSVLSAAAFQFEAVTVKMVGGGRQFPRRSRSFTTRIDNDADAGDDELERTISERVRAEVFKMRKEL